MMGYDGGGVASTNTNININSNNNEGSSSISQRIDGETMWQTSRGLEEGIEGGNYPQRPGEPDCAYYIRAGLCKFGMTCRFNHPPNRNLVLAAARMKGGYPERIGQPECQYYLKTGTCKFGAICKFHHPKDRAGIAGRVQLNILGYPLRPNEQECAYYLRTGQCKFGNTCKFHHPQPSGAMASIRGSTVYPSVHSPTSPGRQSYSGPTNWPLSRPSFIPGPRWQGASSYAQLLLPQGLVQVSGWNTYPASSLQGQLGSSTDNQQQIQGSDQFFNSSRQSGSNTSNVQGSYSSYRSSSVPMGLYTFQRENTFPERPGEPECQFYMKTGDCKFGAVCRFHHPKERTIPIPNCMLSPMGLPLRPGEPLCVFYSRYGICKFGPNCKFDHPMETVTFGYSPFLTGTGSMLMSYDGPIEAGLGKPRRLSLQESRQVANGNENDDDE